MFDTLLLDLDGTLADTAPDMGHAINALLIEEGREPLTNEIIRPYVSHGSMALVRLAFGVEPPDPLAVELRQRFLDHYAAHLHHGTRIFPGMDDALAYCEDQGIKWGIVTNKPGYLTDPLLHELQLLERANCVVSGDTIDRAKPHPDPLWHACSLIDSRPEKTVYIGDAERDIQAGNAAGMTTIVALFGYIRDDENPAQWNADGYIQSPQEVVNLFTA